MAGSCPYRFLGSSGLRVSAICLGTLTFGLTEGCRPGQCDEDSAHNILDKFLELGGNFIDTADVYSGGESEKIIGRWLSRHPEVRDRLVLATKVGICADASDVNAHGLSRHHIMAAVEQSLTHLCTSHIDLYQTHVWDDGTSVEETLGAMRDLVRMGKVRYVGVSNVTGWQFQKFVEQGRKMGVPIVSNQAQYSLLCRSTEWELLEVCKREGVAMLPWSPLKGGLLTGKFKRGETPDSQGSRVGWVDSADSSNSRVTESHPSLAAFSQNDSYWQLLDTLEGIATNMECSPAQVAIAWLLAQPAVSSIVIGARTLYQLQDNMHAVHVKLSQEQLSLLDEASKTPLPYPYELILRLQKGRKRP